jgi:hypothetical protein
MIAASSLAFPGSRTLAGWWRQLLPRQPCAMWVGYLFVHRLEALALARRPKEVDRYSHLILEALDLYRRAPLNGEASTPQDPLQSLDERLHLGRQVVLQSLRGLEAEGLVERSPPSGWQLTSRGQQGLTHRAYPALVLERRAFSFLERLEDNGSRRLPPHFVNLREWPGVPWAADTDHPFDVNLLLACPKQADAWKQTYGFPSDVEALAVPGAALEGAAGIPDWQRVVLDRPERLLAAVIVTAEEPPCLQIFAARQEGWTLHADEALATVERDWLELLPVLADFPMTAWQQAWRAWGQQRGLPAAAAENCRLIIESECLKVESEPLLEHLRGTRHEVLKGDTWLLAGEGLLRPAARIVVAGGQPS